jgi:hypothetical protein
MIPIREYSSSYSGHPIEHLTKIVDIFRHKRRIVWLAGDSSLDNKYWINRRAAPVNGLETILTNGTIPMDVSYHINNILLDSGKEEFICVNCAVEETTLSSRYHRLLPHDTIIQDNIKTGDVLILSVGGNDIALSPSISTIGSLMAVTTLASDDAIKSGTAIGLSHLLHMFNNDTKNYIQRIVSKCSSGGIHVIVCMIYYPAPPSPQSSWADTALGALGYNSNPNRLRLLIKSVYEHGTSKIQIPNCTVTGCPLFDVLDPNSVDDYIARVEPSCQGGFKMATEFVNIITSRL